MSTLPTEYVLFRYHRPSSKKGVTLTEGRRGVAQDKPRKQTIIFLKALAHSSLGTVLQVTGRVAVFGPMTAEERKSRNEGWGAG